MINTFKAANVDAYIAGFPEKTQMLLNKLRATITKAAPGAEELISYNMPAYKLHGRLVYFAGYKNHIGFYPGAVVDRFTKEIGHLKTSKGTIQFPLDKPVPVKLVTQIVKFRVGQNAEKAKKKK